MKRHRSDLKIQLGSIQLNLKEDNKGGKPSFLDFVFRETEKIHSLVRRFTSPDEHPFFTDLPEPVLPLIDFPQVTHKLFSFHEKYHFVNTQQGCVNSENS